MKRADQWWHFELSPPFKILAMPPSVENTILAKLFQNTEQALYIVPKFALGQRLSSASTLCTYSYLSLHENIWSVPTAVPQVVCR
jgi:hypothetical protein